jgi:hypothetical protein
LAPSVDDIDGLAVFGGCRWIGIRVGVYRTALRPFGYLNEMGSNIAWGDINEGRICPLSHLRLVDLEEAVDDSGLDSS